MTKHTESHPLAGQTVKVQLKPDLTTSPEAQERALSPEAIIEADYLEDWWDYLTGQSWMDSKGNFAAMLYAIRAGFASLPTNDEVVYVKIGGMGHIIHTSELVLTDAQQNQVYPPTPESPQVEVPGDDFSEKQAEALQELRDNAHYADGTVDEGM